MISNNNIHDSEVQNGLLIWTKMMTQIQHSFLKNNNIYFNKPKTKHCCDKE